MSTTATKVRTQAPISEVAPWPRGMDPLCFGHETPDIWAPFTEEDRDEAIRICNLCPIKAQCREIAVKRRESGVWGGVYMEKGEEMDLPKNRRVKV